MWFRVGLLILLAGIAYLLFDISRSVGEMTPENQVNVAAEILGIPLPESSYTQMPQNDPFKLFKERFKSQ